MTGSRSATGAPNLAAIADHVTVTLMQKGVFSSPQVMEAVKEFFGFGFEDSYFAITPRERIAEHVYGYCYAKVAPSREFGYACEEENFGFYFCKDEHDTQMATERRMEEKYLSRLRSELEGDSTNKVASSTVSIRSYPACRHGGGRQGGMIMYTVERVPFKQESLSKVRKQSVGGTVLAAESSTIGDIHSASPFHFENLATQHFFDSRTTEARKRYERTMVALRESFHPGIYFIDQVPDGVCLQIAFKPDRVSYLSMLSVLLHAIPHIKFNKKFLETFRNGAQVYTFYIAALDGKEITAETKAALAAASACVGLMPARAVMRPLTDLVESGLMSPRISVYAVTLAMFAYYFVPPVHTDEFAALQRHLSQVGGPGSMRKLKKVRDDMFRELMSEEFIASVLSKHHNFVSELFADFEHGPTAESCQAMRSKINAAVDKRSEREILMTCVSFNRAVRKTNFFSPAPAALAYRLDPSFIAELDYPRVPHTIYFIVGAHFRGFHIRFGDIARGGVRMIRSRGATLVDRAVAYRKNKASVFNENYNLAYTQMLKNKDIPESGSKGTILVSIRSETSARSLYLQYVDALLDLTVPNPPAGVRELGPRKQSDEILFLGPDEGTAGDFPSIAARHARVRGLPTWKSFTTGKLPDIGGIPHDTYGMTTQSVRQYCVGIFDKLRLQESQLTKFMTGGPDGDLGSNEIKMGKEKIVAICDGYASVHDPEGIARKELLRLAENRLSLAHFNKAVLTPQGFWVGVNEHDVTLPDGMVVKDGTHFRNTFHFSRYTDADVFVPCGGRPASVALETVTGMIRNAPGVTAERMLAEKDAVAPEKLRFRYIVEGANLFFTQDARLALENQGVVLFKDASTNKGGVTSSSLEVLTGLALTDVEHKQHMSVTTDRPVPQFYKTLVEEIGARVRGNARREFECLWADSVAGHCGGKRTLISDTLSKKINDIKTYIQESDMDKDTALFRYVMTQYVPQTIQKQVPIDTVIQRVPPAYLKACFAMYIASHFVYETGMSANEFAFFQFMRQLMEKAAAGKAAAKL